MSITKETAKRHHKHHDHHHHHDYHHLVYCNTLCTDVEKVDRLYDVILHLIQLYTACFSSTGCVRSRERRIKGQEREEGEDLITILVYLHLLLRLHSLLVLSSDVLLFSTSFSPFSCCSSIIIITITRTFLFLFFLTFSFILTIIIIIISVQLIFLRWTRRNCNRKKWKHQHQHQKRLFSSRESIILCFQIHFHLSWCDSFLSPSFLLSCHERSLYSFPFRFEIKKNVFSVVPILGSLSSYHDKSDKYLQNPLMTTQVRLENESQEWLCSMIMRQEDWGSLVDNKQSNLKWSDLYFIFLFESQVDRDAFIVSLISGLMMDEKDKNENENSTPGVRKTDDQLCPQKKTCVSASRIIPSRFQSIKKSRWVFKEAWRKRQVLHHPGFVSQTRMVSEAGQLIVDASPFKSLSVTMIFLSHLFLVSPGDDDGWTDEWSNLSLSFSSLHTWISIRSLSSFTLVSILPSLFVHFVGNKVWHLTAFFFFFIMKSNGVDHSFWKESKGERTWFFISLFFSVDESSLKFLKRSVLKKFVCFFSFYFKSWLPLSKKLSLFEPVTDRRLPEEQIESKAKQDNSTFHLQCVVSPTAVFLLMITVITWSEGRRTWIESKERRRTFDKWIWIEDDCSFSSKASLYLYKKRLQIQLWFHIWSWESTVNERDEKAPLMSSLLFPVSSNR